MFRYTFKQVGLNFGFHTIIMVDLQIIDFVGGIKLILKSLFL